MEKVLSLVYCLGVLHYANGNEYNGDWKDDVRHGKGIFNENSGSRYDGDWFNDQKHGKGKLECDFGRKD